MSLGCSRSAVFLSFLALAPVMSRARVVYTLSHAKQGKVSVDKVDHQRHERVEISRMGERPPDTALDLDQATERALAWEGKKEAGSSCSKNLADIETKPEASQFWIAFKAGSAALDRKKKELSEEHDRIFKQYKQDEEKSLKDIDDWEKKLPLTRQDYHAIKAIETRDAERKAALKMQIEAAQFNISDLEETIQTLQGVAKEYTPEKVQELIEQHQAHARHLASVLEQRNKSKQENITAAKEKQASLLEKLEKAKQRVADNNTLKTQLEAEVEELKTAIATFKQKQEEAEQRGLPAENAKLKETEDKCWKSMAGQMSRLEKTKKCQDNEILDLLSAAYPKLLGTMLLELKK